MDILSLVGIVVGLVLLIALAYKGHSIIWVAPVCAVVVAVFGGLNLLDAYMVDYMSGAANFVLTWFPSFFLGAVFGKMMDDIKKGIQPNDAYTKNIGTYGRFKAEDGAVKWIDPRKE